VALEALIFRVAQDGPYDWQEGGRARTGYGGMMSTVKVSLFHTATILVLVVDEGDLSNLQSSERLDWQN
jgi:hypothetical protein